MNAYCIGRKHQVLPTLLPSSKRLLFNSINLSFMYRGFAPSFSATSEDGIVASSMHFCNAFNIISSVYFTSDILDLRYRMRFVYKRIMPYTTCSIMYICHKLHIVY